MTYHAIDFDRYPISPLLCFFFFFFFFSILRKLFYVLFYALVDVKWKAKISFLGTGFWLNNKKWWATNERLLNVATFLVRDGFRALFNTFLLNCDSTTTTRVWARSQHFVSLLQFKTKLNASMAARNKRNKPSITFRRNILQMWESHWCVSIANFKYYRQHFNLGIAFCLVS